MMSSRPLHRRSALGSSLIRHSALALLPGLLLASAACSDSAPSETGPDGDGSNVEMPDNVDDGGAGGSGGAGGNGGGSSTVNGSVPALRGKVTLTDDALAKQ